jgi:GT2 family glycosyltransferase
MTSRDLTLVVVGSDEQNMRRFDLSHCGAAETMLVINYGNVALSVIGNVALSWLRPGAVLGLCHADVFFGPGALDAMAQCAGEGNVCGVVGMNPDLKEDSPGRNPGATKETQRWGEVWADKNPGPVSTLDSAAVFFRRDSGLLFDSVNFDGMHLHVEDLCLQAQQRGIPVVVPAANATHYSNPNLNNWEDWWHKDYRRYYERFRMKWQGVRYGTT